VSQGTGGGAGRKTHFQVGAPRAADRELRAIAVRLRALRRARGLTQWALAERGVSYKYYQRLEAGHINPTVRTLARVAQALGVPLLALFHSTTDSRRTGNTRERGNVSRRRVRP
jgi:transcriptional regulator with XRE-family HTH domain